MHEHKDDFDHRQNPARANRVHKRRARKGPTPREKRAKAMLKMIADGDAYVRKHMC
jgi:hypothetical protein